MLKEISYQFVLTHSVLKYKPYRYTIRY